MSRTLLLFSSDLERNAAYPDGIPKNLLTDLSGVGLIDAGIGTLRCIREHQPAAIVFMGTCGAFRRSNLLIGDVVVADVVRLSSGDVASGAMRFPTLLPSVLSTHAELSKLIRIGNAALGVVLHTGSVGCTLGVTETDELAHALHNVDRSSVENLEAFSVLRAAGSIPTAIVLGVTNIVGAGGGRDWAANFRKVMRVVVNVVGVRM